jgi:hypothetical protein
LSSKIILLRKKSSREICRKSHQIEYVPHGEGKKGRREKVEPVIMPNIITSGLKKGGGGVYTPGVLFG